MTEVSPEEVHEKLDNIEYPASKQQLIKYAKEHGNKDENVIEALRQIPEGSYDSPVDVSKALEDILAGGGVRV